MDFESTTYCSVTWAKQTCALDELPIAISMRTGRKALHGPLQVSMADKLSSRS
jgi:hypothetical protein